MGIGLPARAALAAGALARPLRPPRLIPEQCRGSTVGGPTFATYEVERAGVLGSGRLRAESPMTPPRRADDGPWSDRYHACSKLL
jgi:hypothetical protein